MSLLKRLERVHRRMWYAALRPVLRNRPVEMIDGDRVGKILILRYDAVGDMVVTTPVLDILRRHLPAVQVDVVASPRNVGIIRHDPRVRRGEVHDGTLRSALRLRREARPEGYDVVLNFVSVAQPDMYGVRLRGLTEAGILSNIVGGRDAVKVSQLSPDRRRLNAVFFNLQVPAHDGLPMVETQARLACDAFGWPFDPTLCRMRIALGPEHRDRALAFHRSIGEAPFVAFNISSRQIRRWSLARNRAFLELLLARHPEVQIVVLSAPQNAWEANVLASVDGSRVAVYPASPDILDVCAVIERSEMVVTPDTSIVHIAAAFARPVLGFYSSMRGEINEWMPYGVPHRAVITRGELPIDTIPLEEAVRAFGDLYGSIQART